MKNFLIGLILGFLAVPLGFYALARLGKIPVATSAPPMPMERMLAGTALHARLKGEAPTAPAIEASAGTYLAGADIYKQHCAVCHGLSGGKPTAIAKGMFPAPPQLLEPDEMVTDDPPGVTFWKAKNGIRLTGMPGFHASLSDEQLWQVSLLLAHADKLPEKAKQAVAAEPAALAK
jgi:thiosulfate dehydrogenase